MNMLRMMDPRGVQLRKRKRLQRRVYLSKVIKTKYLTLRLFLRDPIIAGMSMGTANCHLSTCIFTVVLMGKTLQLYTVAYSYSCHYFRFSRKILWMHIGSTNSNPGVTICIVLTK